MLYGIPLICLAAAWLFRRQGVTRAHRTLWITLAYLSMFAQSAALLYDGQWSVKTGLPLHVCGFSGVMSLPALTRQTPALSRFMRRVAMPGALLALLFPAVFPTRLMTLSEISFFLLHSLLLSLPLLLSRKGMDAGPLRRARESGATGMYRLCLALLAAAIAVNARFQANYLFLRSLPPGAPFEALNACPDGLRALAAFALAVALSYAGGKRQRRVG